MTVWNNRNYCIEQLKGRDLTHFDIYEFGIYTGNSFKQIYEAMQECKVRPAKVWGFDSFEGLPAEAPGVPLGEGWEQGNFRVDDPDIMNIISRSVDGSIPFELVKGFFHDTLNAQLLPRLKEAIFLDIDSDLYISCYEILDFFFSHRLIARGCLISYDDWGGAIGIGGESKAHADIMQKYKVDCAEVFSVGDKNIEKAFLVRNY